MSAEIVTTKLPFYCDACAFGGGCGADRVDCDLEPGHDGLHWDRHIGVWWRADNKTLCQAEGDEP